MAASVRIEDEAFSDERYEVLATACGLTDADHARGKMIRLWRQCTAMHTYILSASVVDAVLGANGAAALVESQLGEVVDGGIRIRGTRGRIEWLKKLRKNAQKGGKARAAKRQEVGKQEEAKSVPPLSPPAPAPAPAQEEDQSVSGKPDAGPFDLFRQKADTLAPEHNTNHAHPLKRPAGADLAEVACREINRIGGRNYKPDSKAVLKLCAALEKSARTPEQVTAVVASKRAWVNDPKMGQFFSPHTLLAAENFAKYLDEIDARTASRGPAQDSTGEHRVYQSGPIVEYQPDLLRLALDALKEPDAAS